MQLFQIHKTILQFLSLTAKSPLVSYLSSDFSETYCTVKINFQERNLSHLNKVSVNTIFLSLVYASCIVTKLVRNQPVYPYTILRQFCLHKPLKANLNFYFTSCKLQSQVHITYKQSSASLLRSTRLSKVKKPFLGWKESNWTQNDYTIFGKSEWTALYPLCYSAHNILVQIIVLSVPLSHCRVLLSMGLLRR